MTRIAIDPLTRVEGHGKVTLQLDAENRVIEARLHIVEFRGFEKFIQGRPYWEVPVLVERLCGICPVSHHLASAKAIDRIMGAEKLTPTAEKLRRLLHFGQVLQSHALHFFHLSSPDLLFGFDSEVQLRNIAGLMKAYPDLALKGVKLRKYGQEVIQAIMGKRIHGTGAVPGGMNKALTIDERDRLTKDVDDIIEWADDAVDLVRNIFLSDPAYMNFAGVSSSFLSIVGEGGMHELYDGRLRCMNGMGEFDFDGVSDSRYSEYIREEVESWSYMKFPYLVEGHGMYRVGPLARVNNCSAMATPLAESRRKEFASKGRPVHATLAYHWARMIELLHCAESIRDLLHDPDIMGEDLRVETCMGREGVGVIEAPRGTLIHHYRIDEEGLVEMANLIVSTTHNNRAMNEAILSVAKHHIEGRQEITEGMLNRIEVAIRAFDPCLSCATHAVGKMPLKVEVLDPGGEPLCVLTS